MIRFIVADDDLGMIRFEDMDHAAEFCHQSKLPFFYEVDLNNFSEPKKVWYVKHAFGKKPYELTSRDYKSLEVEHDAHHAHH